MKYETLDDPNTPIRIIFEGDNNSEEFDEVDVIRSAYREAILYRAQKGNTSSISNFDRFVAKNAEDTESNLVLRLHSEVQILEVLDQFYERTEQALIEIPDQSLIPPFENTYIVTRFRLGEMALNLANEIREAQQSLTLSDWEIQQQVDSFAAELEGPIPED